MYSIVMVAAMTAAPTAPDFFCKSGGCYGCNGCSGYSYSYGCCGGGCCGGYGYGGCCGGWGYGGCCGGFGCHGAVTVYSCSGCCGWSNYPVGPYGGLAYSGCHGAQPYYTGCMGYGNYYAPVGPGMAGYGYGTLVVPTPGYVTGSGTGAGTGGSSTGPAPGGSTTPGGSASPGGGSGAPAGGAGPGGISIPGVPEAITSLPANRAQVVVKAPAGAKLFADGQATSLSGTERVFLTPELSAGRDFQYTLKIENGSDSTTKSVVVRAGHRTVVDFNEPVTEKATSPVTVNLPLKAKLYVDGVVANVAGGTQTFRTPELAKGKKFVYDFRAEINQVDGKTEVVSKKVTFNAGEPVVVDFNAPTAVQTAQK